MKRFLFLLLLFSAKMTTAQAPTEPPKFQGAGAQRYMARLTGEFEKVVCEEEIPAGELSQQVCMAITIDTTGAVTRWRLLDNTCEDADYREVEPATERTQEALTEAAARLERWTPARRGGEPVSYTYLLTLRLPVEKIARKQDGEPLLFMGADPARTFHDWATLRTHYDRRFTARGVEGLVHVRFYIEPDGAITIDEVVRTPDEKLSREVVRVIKSSRDKWTPRRKDGVPQRSVYDYRVNFQP